MFRFRLLLFIRLQFLFIHLFLSLFPDSFYSLLIWQYQYSISLHHPIKPKSLISPTIWPLILTITLSDILVILSHIFFSFNPNKFSMTLHHSFNPISFVSFAIWPDEFSFSVDFSIRKASFK